MRLRQLSLVKGSHRYIFRYSAGSEAEVINSFGELADDIDNDFDWFDAAVLSYQMGKQLSQDAEQIGSVIPD